MLTTTFALIKEKGTCTSGYRKLARHLGGIKTYGASTPMTRTIILDNNGLFDALWCLKCCQDQQAAEKLARLLAADFAEHVLHFYEEKYPKDKRPRLAIEATRLFAKGKITAAVGAAAWAAAWDAARDAAWGAVGAAAWAAARASAGAAALDAAWAAARAAALDAAWDAALDAVGAAAWDAAWGAVGAAALDAENKWQAERFKEVLNA
jgi:hypothetical protein